VCVCVLTSGIYTTWGIKIIIIIICKRAQWSAKAKFDKDCPQSKDDDVAHRMNETGSLIWDRSDFVADRRAAFDVVQLATITNPTHRAGGRSRVASTQWLVLSHVGPLYRTADAAPSPMLRSNKCAAFASSSSSAVMGGS